MNAAQIVGLLSLAAVLAGLLIYFNTPNNGSDAQVTGSQIEGYYFSASNSDGTQTLHATITSEGQEIHFVSENSQLSYVGGNLYEGKNEEGTWTWTCTEPSASGLEFSSEVAQQSAQLLDVHDLNDGEGSKYFNIGLPGDGALIPSQGTLDANNNILRIGDYNSNVVFTKGDITAVKQAASANANGLAQVDSDVSCQRRLRENGLGKQNRKLTQTNFLNLDNPGTNLYWLTEAMNAAFGNQAAPTDCVRSPEQSNLGYVVYCTGAPKSGWMQNYKVIVFSGTNSADGWKANKDGEEVHMPGHTDSRAKIHGGMVKFCSQYNTWVDANAGTNSQDSILFAGHSQGGMCAMYHAARRMISIGTPACKIAVITVGSPAVIARNSMSRWLNFAGDFNQFFKNVNRFKVDQQCRKNWRSKENMQDAVTPLLNSNFDHVGTENKFRRYYNSNGEKCSRYRPEAEQAKSYTYEDNSNTFNLLSPSLHNLQNYYMEGLAYLKTEAPQPDCCATC